MFPGTALDRSNRNGSPSAPILESELHALRHHKIVSWLLPVYAGFLQLIDPQIDHVLDPIIGIPVEPNGVLVGVVIECGNKTVGEVVLEARTRFVGVDAGESEGEFPRSPATSLAARSVGAEQRTIDP